MNAQLKWLALVLDVIRILSGKPEFKMSGILRCILQDAGFFLEKCVHSMCEIGRHIDLVYVNNDRVKML